MTIAKAALLTGLSKAFDIQELEWEDPRDDEVGIRLAVRGVCHTDYHMKVGDTSVPLSYPLLTGHEGGGIVERVGKNVERVKVGEKVILSWVPSCGQCPSCIAGQGHLCNRGAAS
jgi:Zn-dependent alcohol dehydrogenase